MKVNCPAQNDCWRLAYSKYFLEMGYETPPTREEIFLAGYAEPRMLPRGGIFAETIPLPGKGGVCPELEGGANFSCAEFQKWEKKHKHDEERKKRFQQKSPRVFIPENIRRQVAAASSYKCVYCGIAQGQYRNGSRVRCVVDHHIPLALRGSSDISNLVFCCQDCNKEKGVSLWKLGQKLGNIS